MQTPELSSKLLELANSAGGVISDETKEKLVKLAQARYDFNPPISYTGTQWIYWGAENNLPTKAIMIVNGNSVSRQALDKVAQYIVGNGFKEQTMNELPTSTAAPKQHKDYVSLKHLVSQVAKQMSFWDGSFALLVRRSDDGAVAAIECLELGDLRKVRPAEGSEPSMYMYMPGSINTNDMFRNRVDLPRYYGPKVNAEWAQAEKQRQLDNYKVYYGEVLFHFVSGVGIDHYPIPKWYSSSEFIQGDSALNRAFQFTAAAAFVPPTYLLMPDMEQQQKAIFESEVMRKINGEQSRSINTLYFKSPEMKPEIISTNNSSQSNTITDAAEKSAQQVCRLHGVDPALCGYSVAGQLGNNQQLAVAEGMLNDMCRGLRAELLEVLEPLVTSITGQWNAEWAERSTYVDIPKEAWEVMTMEEKRARLGLPVLEVTTNATADAINVMSPLVANKVLDSMTRDEIRALAMLMPAVQPAMANNPQL